MVHWKWRVNCFTAVTTVAIKLYLTSKGLNFRREHHELFKAGNYLPLTVEGVCMKHVCAFERSIEGCSVLVVAPLLL